MVRVTIRVKILVRVRIRVILIQGCPAQSHCLLINPTRVFGCYWVLLGFIVLLFFFLENGQHYLEAFLNVYIPLFSNVNDVVALRVAWLPSKLIVAGSILASGVNT